MVDNATLRLYVIHTQSLVSRQGRLHGTIQSIRQIAQSIGLKFQSILILKPDSSELIPNIAALNTRVTYESVNEPAFDEIKHVLNIEEISNIEKHREAWRRIQSSTISQNDKIMIIEDDNILPSENINYLASILRQPADAWDYLDLSLSIQQNSEDPILFVPIHMHTKILISKQAYMITPATAKVFLRETETIRFSTRGHISYAIHKFHETELKKAYFSSKRIMLEGSKVGIFPSSLHNSNILIYNSEYMQMRNMMIAYDKENTPIDETTARNIFKGIEHINSSDIFLMYGILLKKLGYPAEALKIFEKGLDIHQKTQGMMNQQTELLNEIINIHEDLQKSEIDEYMKTTSKYSI